MAVEYKTGDTWPPLSGTCEDDDGPVDLSAATGPVRVIIKPPSGTAIAGTVTLVGTGSTGQWKRNWGVSDLAVAGTYEVEVEVTWVAASTPPEVETFPNSKTRNPKFTVTDDLD